MQADDDGPLEAEASGPAAPDGEFSDETLVARVRQGDEEAARQLFDRNVAGLRARVRRRLPPPSARRSGSRTSSKRPTSRPF